jgi:hypothetical protein
MATPARVRLSAPAWVNIPTKGECINSAVISGNGSVVVAGTFCHDYGASTPKQVPPPCSETGTFGTFFYDAAGLEFFHDQFTGWQGVVSVAISRDGSTGASCGWLKTNPDTGFVFAYTVSGAQTSRSLSHYIVGAQGRGNMVALSADGSTLVSGADQLYVFSRSGQGWTGPVIISFPAGDTDDYVTAIGLSGDGTRVVAITANGYVMLASYSGGAWSKAASWKITSGELHAIAISVDGSGFVAGATTSTSGVSGRSDSGTVFYFDTQTFSTSSNPAPGWSLVLAGCNSCRTVALSDDASYFSAAGGAPTELDPPSAGGFVVLGQCANQGSMLWSKPLMRSPNSTSLDSQALFVTVSDGFPDPSPQQPRSPGHFYVFDRNGKDRGIAETNMMNWPMQISADASAVVGGSDDGRVFYWARKTEEGGPLIG